MLACVAFHTKHIINKTWKPFETYILKKNFKKNTHNFRYDINTIKFYLYIFIYKNFLVDSLSIYFIK